MKSEAEIKNKLNEIYSKLDEYENSDNLANTSDVLSYPVKVAYMHSYIVKKEILEWVLRND